MSRLLETFLQGARAPEEAEGDGPCRVFAVTSNKGGVGKTTLATNLAVFLRALREDLPVLFLELDDQSMADRMFALDADPPRETMLTALRAGSFEGAIRTGQYGVHYVPTSPQISELKGEIRDPFRLQAVLRRTRWRGIVIIDTKSDLEILTRNALAASDLAITLVANRASLDEADRVFALLDEWRRPRASIRILLSLMDLRVKFSEGEKRDVLAMLVSEIRRRGYPLFETFISRSPKIEALYTNPQGSAASILHGAPSSIVYRQLRALAEEVLRVLDEAPERPAPAAPGSLWDRFPELIRPS